MCILVLRKMYYTVEAGPREESTVPSDSDVADIDTLLPTNDLVHNSSPDTLDKYIEMLNSMTSYIQT